jgi:hypothetical protein
MKYKITHIKGYVSDDSSEYIMYSVENYPGYIEPFESKYAAWQKASTDATMHPILDSDGFTRFIEPNVIAIKLEAVE